MDCSGVDETSPSPIAKSPEHEEESGSPRGGEKSRREEPERTLTDAQRDEFENMLRALTDNWNQIKEAMGFALDNAIAASELVDVLTQALTLKGTPIGKKVAWLVLVSFILQESGAPGRNASAYRTKFKATLPDIMESFSDLYHSKIHIMDAKVLKELVLRVLQGWANRSVFSDAYVNGLEATFLRSGNSCVTPFHSRCGPVPEIEQRISSEDTVVCGKTNEDLALSMGQEAATKELMSLPLAELLRRWCEHNGLSLDRGREMMIANLSELDTSIHAESQMDEEKRFCSSSIIHKSDCHLNKLFVYLYSVRFQLIIKVQALKI